MPSPATSQKASKAWEDNDAASSGQNLQDNFMGPKARAAHGDVELPYSATSAAPAVAELAASAAAPPVPPLLSPDKLTPVGLCCGPTAGEDDYEHKHRPVNAGQLLWRFLRVATAFFNGDAKWKARLLMAALVAFGMGSTGMYVVISYTQRDFSTALTEKKAAEFYACLTKFSIIICIAAPYFALYDYVQGLFKLEWRLWLTNLLLSKYFANKAFFDLKMAGLLDNPDERICQDVDRFVGGSVSVIIALVEKLLNVIAFAAVLWSISPSLMLFLLMYATLGTIISLKVFGRKLMWLQFEGVQREADMRYSLVRVRDNVESIAFYRGEQREAAAVRAYLYRVATNTRQRLGIGFQLNFFTNAYDFATIFVPSMMLAARYFGGEIEYGVITQTDYAFTKIYSAFAYVVLNFYGLSSLAAETERLESLLHALGIYSGDKSISTHLAEKPPAAAAAAAAVAAAKTGAASVAAMGCKDNGSGRDGKLHEEGVASVYETKGTNGQGEGVAKGEGVLPSNGERTGEEEGLASKMSSMERREDAPLLDTLRQHVSSADIGVVVQDEYSDAGTITRRHGSCLSLSGLMILTPNTRERLFPFPLTLSLSPSDSLLVMGPSGCGKSSLLRAICGLWTNGEGIITCPPKEQTFFLPQKPYMPLGSLRDQLLFPLPARTRGAELDSQLLSILSDVHLPDLADRFGGLDAERDWADTLSVGEQQRVAFARLLLQAPCCRLAFLDEATSALDPANERQLYSRLREKLPSYVSVGHRASLVAFHSKVLWFGEDTERWQLQDAAEFRQARGLTTM